MDNQVQNAIVNFIWGIADDCLRDVYTRGKYRDVILPMTVIRRLDAMLEDTKPAVLEMKKKMDEAGITNQWPALCNAAGQAFCNSSPFLLRDLTSRAKKQTLKADFEAYLDGFSPNVQEILDKFKFRNQIDTMVEADVLGAVIEKFVSPTMNLSPKPVYTDDTMQTIKLPALDNHGMGTIYEELLRKFNEDNNEEAGEFWTPRDVVDLMADLIIIPIADKIMDATYSCYDGACGTGGIEMHYEDDNIWLTQKMMATLYDVDVRTINEYIKKIYSDSELEEDATIRNFRIVQIEGSRQVTRDIKHYNLQMIIAVGFKVNNERAVQFRKWANSIVKDYTIKGWAMDDERLKNGGSVLTVEYFDRLLEQIREIRLSERRFYQKITDIYATALDYDRTAKTTKQFFAKVQNKIVKSDVNVAKNYLSEQEMRSLERIVSAYLDLAEDRAERHIPMTMEDWAKHLDLFLMADDREVLQDAGKITAEIAKAKAETEFEKYRVVQDRLFMSDFDRYMLELEENAKKYRKDGRQSE